MSAVKIRHTRRNPCRVCRGCDEDRRGQGVRCHGFTSEDGKYVHCSRHELAGGLIEEAGGTMEHLVKVVVYITDVRHREAVYRTMGEYIKGVHPVSTGLVVQALARPEWLVEIDGTAVIPD